MITAQSYELSNQNRMFGNQSSAISRCTEIELRTQPGAAEMAVMLAASACPSPAPGLRIKPELLLELGQWRVKVPGRGGLVWTPIETCSRLVLTAWLCTRGESLFPLPSPLVTTLSVRASGEICPDRARESQELLSDT